MNVCKQTSEGLKLNVPCSRSNICPDASTWSHQDIGSPAPESSDTTSAVASSNCRDGCARLMEIHEEPNKKTHGVRPHSQEWSRQTRRTNKVDHRRFRETHSSSVDWKVRAELDPGVPNREATRTPFLITTYHGRLRGNCQKDSQDPRNHPQIASKTPGRRAESESQDPCARRQSG